ncbi:MAG: 3-deoxy-D-manno-octulosonic acid transferase [Pseudobdellovibrionaceae bacterium]
MVERLLFLVYRGLMFLLVPLAKLIAPILPKKLQASLVAKDTNSLQRLTSRPVWIHASSGEIEYAKPILRELKQRFPQLSVVVSYSSPSFLKLQQGLESCELIFAAPFDRPQDIQKIIKAIHPCVVLFARTDVWPELSYQLRKASIPTALFSATISRQSTRSQGLGKYLTRFALNQLSAVFCVSEEDKRILSEMAVRAPLIVQGDTRYDQVLYRLQTQSALSEQTLQKLKTSFSWESTLVLGSTWPEDDEVLFDSLKHWFEQGGQVIWCPHEVHSSQIAGLQEKIRQRNWKSILWLNWLLEKSAAEKPQILIIDQIGILSQLYTVGKWAFVGGSFKQKVHSVMEALAGDAIVFTGPHIENNREAVEFSRVSLNDHLFAVNPLQSSAEIVKLLADQRKTQSPAAMVQKRAGATTQLADWVEATVQQQIQDLRRQ